MALSLAAGILAALILAAFRRPRLLRLACRWLAGGSTRGGPRGPFPGRPRRVRAAWRTGGTLAVLAALWGLLFARTVTLVTLAAAGLAGAVLGVLGAVRWARGRRHYRTWTYPAHLVAAPIAGIPPGARPRSWLTVAPDRSRVVAELPPSWEPDAASKTRLAGALAGKLGLESPQARWTVAGPAPRLELTQSAPPPSRVTLDDARAVLEAAKDDELTWGLGKRGTPVRTSLSGDSPHVGLSMGSGAGKSVTARSLLAQQLHRGAIGLVLDVKFISHQWAAGLPNVVIARRAPEIHAALLWLGAEVDRRNEVALAGADMDGNVTADVGPRIIVLAEELNATMGRLRTWWKDTRGPDDPPRSPAIAALDDASFMGRQVKTHIVYIGQRLSDKATGGGGDARENIGVIAFGRWRASTWKMLAPDFAMPPRNLAPGRLQVVSDQVRECQGILMSAAEAREFALSGVTGRLPSTMPGAAATGVAPMLKTGPDQQFATSVASPPVALREAMAAGLLGDLTLSALRSARHRDRTFPASCGRDGTTDLYDPAGLAEWAAGRK